MRRFYLFIFFFLCSIQAFSVSLVLKEEFDKDTVDLLPFLEHLYSSVSDTLYTDLESFKLHPGLKSSRKTGDKTHHYFKVNIENRSEQVKDLIIQLPKIDYARLQVYKDGRLSKVLRTGDLTPFIDKSIPHNVDGYEEFRIKLPKGTYTLVFVINDRDEVIPLKSAFIFSFNTWKKGLYDSFSYRELGQGMFHGNLWVMLVFSLFFYILTKNKSAIRLVISCLTMSIYMFIAFGFVPPVLPALDPKIIIGLNHLFLLISLYSFISFLVYFTNSDSRHPKAARIVTWSKWVILALYGVSLIFLFSEALLDKYYYLRFAIGCYLMVVWFVYSVIMLKQSGENRMIMISSLVMFFGTAGTLFFFFSQPEQVTIYRPIQTGYIISLILMSLVMVNRYRSLLRNKISFQSRLINQIKKNEELQRGQKEILEREVEKRTTEIQAQNEELVQQQEELAAQRDMLEHQSKTIEEQNVSLRNYNVRLKKDVLNRTTQLESINQELITQNQQLEQFSYILAHNLRSPVARLLGLTNLFGLAENDDMDEIINRISDSAEDLNEVLKDLNAILEIKRGEGPVKSKVSISHQISKCINQYKEQIEQYNIKVIKDIQVDEVVTVKAYLESIIVNLISNAIKYRSSDQPFIKLTSQKNNGQVVIIIEDNGIGIDLKVNEQKIFGIYQRFHTHIQGKGMGLYLVKAQVEALQGEILIDSEVDKGTKFTIRFPE